MLEVWGYLFLKNVIHHFFICFSVVWILCTSVQILPFTSQQPCHTVHVWNRCNWSILVTSFALVWTTNDWLFWRKTHRVFFIAVRTANGFNVLIGTACHMNWLYRALYFFVYIIQSAENMGVQFALIFLGVYCAETWWRLKPIAIPATYIDAVWRKAWTSGQSSGSPSSFVWTGDRPVTQGIDLSRAGSHLALDVNDLQLHRYDGATDKMGAFCEISKPLTVTCRASFTNMIQIKSQQG